MPALREIFADFGIKFNTAALKRGDRAVDRMEDSLRDLDDGLRDAGEGVATFFDKIQKAGDVLRSVGEIGKWVRGIWEGITGDLAERTREVTQWSARLRLPPETLYAWSQLAQQIGAEVDDVGDSFKDLQVRAYDATTGTQSYIDAFKTVGITMEQVRPIVNDSQALMDLFSDALARQTDSAKAAFAADELLGDVGIRMLPILRQGSAALRRQRDEISRLGGRDIPKLSEQTSRISRESSKWRATLDGLRSQFLLRFGPVLERILQRLQEWTKVVSDWLKTDRARVVIDRFVQSLESGITKIEQWVGFIGDLIDKSYLLESAFDVLLVAAGVLVGVGIAVNASWAPFILTVAGVAAAIAAGVLVVDDLRVAMDGGKSVTREWVKELLGAKKADTVFQGLRHSLDVVGEGIRLVFRSTTDFVGGPLGWLVMMWKDVNVALEGQPSLYARILEAMLGLERTRKFFDWLKGVLESIGGALGWVARTAAAIAPGEFGAGTERARRRQAKPVVEALRAGAEEQLIRTMYPQMTIQPAGGGVSNVEQNVSAPMSVDITVQGGDLNMTDVIIEEIRRERDRGLRELQANLT